MTWDTCTLRAESVRPKCPRCGGGLTIVSEGQIPKRMGCVVVFDHVPFVSCNACEAIYRGTSLHGYGVRRFTKGRP